MRTTAFRLATGLLLASGSAHAVPGLGDHDDTIYTEDLLLQSRPHRVDVTITDHGPEPRGIPVDEAEKLELVVTRMSALACRSDLLVTGYDVRAAIPDAQPVAITLLTFGRGTIHLACPAEDGVPGDAAVTPPAVKPASEGKTGP